MSLEPHNQVTGLSVSLKVRAIRRSMIGLSVTLWWKLFAIAICRTILIPCR